MNVLTELPNFLMEKLEEEEMILVSGGIKEEQASPNNGSGRCDGPNNADGYCGK